MDNLGNQLIVSFIRVLPRPLVKPFAMRYVAGERLDDAVRVVRALNSQSLAATVDVLGENVTTEEESLLSVRSCEKVLRTIDENHLDSTLSVKLTQLGLKIDERFCYSNLKRLVEIALGFKNFVRIDMEDSSTTSATLNLYKKLRSEGFQNVGVVIQAYLRRSEEDIRRLIDMESNVRLCKGIYVEPESIAFKDRGAIQRNYLKLLKMLMEGHCHVAIATHDDILVEGAYRYLRELNVKRTNYEFQMLLGVREKLRDKIASAGQRLRVYVPFGHHWYAYSMRRFKENPQIARYVFRALFSRD